MAVSMHKNKKTTLGRIQGFISKGPLSKNPIQSNKIVRMPSLFDRLYTESIPFSELFIWRLPGGHGSWQQYKFNDIVNQTFVRAELGEKFGPIWSTHWLKAIFHVPEEFKGKELHLRFNSGSEASIWNAEGEILGAFSPNFRDEYIISKEWLGLSHYLIFYIEVACNGIFGGGMVGENLNINPPNEKHVYVLDQLEISVFDAVVFKLLMDLEMLYGMAVELTEEPRNDHRGYQAMYTANEMINLIIAGKMETASQIADTFFREGNGSKVHSLVAMGHCHIDTAWLWPYDETIRKCLRSWKCQVELMKQYPEFKFVCSQAQQFYWVKKYYPAFFEEIKEWVKKGSLVPVGGSWVEMDGLLPSGESFIRQFFHGQTFFKTEFGVHCKEFWLPDTFGYSGQIPQILKHVGINRFLTQKLSWSMVNKFPHHNFIWEGIDGSQILVHFPPGDSYTMTASVKEILKSASNSEDKGRVNAGAYLFGHGDGGGGPTVSMIEKLTRVRDVDGLPKVQMGHPHQFFESLTKEKANLCKWVGELYLELHNGTYTSQAKIKWYNRKLEQFLMEVELIMAIAYSSGKIKEEHIQKDMKLMDRCWRRLLLNQFHDVIPGSCIQLVANDAWRIYKSVWRNLIVLQRYYTDQLLQHGDSLCILNPLGWNVKMVITSSDYKPHEQNNYPQSIVAQEVVLDDHPFCEEECGERRKLPFKFYAIPVNLKASGYTELSQSYCSPQNPITLSKQDEYKFGFSNGIVHLKVEVNPQTRVPIERLTFGSKERGEMTIFEEDKEERKPGMFYIFDDVPVFWDAWDCMDYHLETRKELECIPVEGPIMCAEGPFFSAYKWTARFGSGGSSFTRYTILRADSPMLEYFLVVDWKESHKFLKVEFPLDILSRSATYEIQYGHLERPTHTNTPWDMAQFEVSGHKWMDVSQADKGVTFITDCKYGWHVRDNIVQLSLLRSPKSPDGNCDMHRHIIHYAVFPHEGSFQSAGTIRKAYEFNFLSANDVSARDFNLDEGTCAINNWVVASHPAVVVECVKIAAVMDRTVCIRLYESFGGACDSRVSFGFPVIKVLECNGLEEPLRDETGLEKVFECTQQFNNDDKCKKHCVTISLTPFQIKSYLVKF